MSTHRRNWNTDFENLSYDLYKENEEFFSDKTLEIYEKLSGCANEEIENLNGIIDELKQENDDLRQETDDLRIELEELNRKLEELDEIIYDLEKQLEEK